MFSIGLRDRSYRDFEYSTIPEDVPAADVDLRLAEAFPAVFARSTREETHFDYEFPDTLQLAPPSQDAPLPATDVPSQVAWVGLLDFTDRNVSIEAGILVLTPDQAHRLCLLALRLFAIMRDFAAVAGIDCPETYDGPEYLITLNPERRPLRDREVFAPFTLEDDFGRRVRFRHGRTFIAQTHPLGLHALSRLPICLVADGFTGWYMSTRPINELLHRWTAGFLLYVTQNGIYDGLAPQWTVTIFSVPRLIQMLLWYYWPSPDHHGLRPRHFECMSSPAGPNLAF